MIKKTTGNALVLGLGASGIAACRLLRKEGWAVTVVDQRLAAAKDLAAYPETAGIEFVSDTAGVSSASTDFAVVSPGIPFGHPWLRDLEAKGVLVLPEFEFGISFMKSARVVAVTGSNGKSSLVKWISDTLNRTGVKSLPAGNYGLPPSQIAFEGSELDVVVLELSSFQLEQAVEFRPDIGILLNLTPNHLDRHGTFEAYAGAKARMFEKMSAGCEAIIHEPAFELVRTHVPEDIKPWLFMEGSAVEVGFHEGSVVRRGREPVDLRGTWWGERPLGVNASAGVVAMDILGVSPADMQASAAAFAPLPHRQEEVTVYRGVRFVNDSKASTMAALAAAVVTGPEKKHLIAGGILKESDISFVKEVLAKNCAFVYCIGSVAEKLVMAWKDVVPCENCRDLSAAVESAFRRVKSGETVILSPGCSSFDQFTSYAQRGQKFKDLVQECIQRNRREEITMQGVRI